MLLINGSTFGLHVLVPPEDISNSLVDRGIRAEIGQAADETTEFARTWVTCRGRAHLERAVIRRPDEQVSRHATAR